MRVLFTGLGSIGRRHLTLVRDRLDNVEALGYRSGQSGEDDLPTHREFDALDDALAADPDIAFITNPTHKHVETALTCAQADCDLFIEKPLSHTLDDVDTLRAEVASRELVAHVGCQFRFDPVLNRIRSLLAGGHLGSVRSFRAYSGSYLPDWRQGQDHRQSYSADPAQGGGVVLDLIHELDYSRWLFGPPTRLASVLSTVESLGITSEAIAEIIIETDAGVPGAIHLDYCRRQPRRTLEVICDEATVSGNLLAGTVTIEWPEETVTESFAVNRNDRFRAQLNHILWCIDNRKPTTNDLDQAKELLKTALTVKGDTDG